MKKADIGMVGLAVMGENLSRNIERHGYTVAVYDVRENVVDKFTQKYKGNFIGANSFLDLCDKLSKPRKIFIMIKAGDPVDEVIGKLLPYLNKGDVIIDGGNSNFEDTIRRCKLVEEKGMYYIGTGVSGGEEGALHGPSLMPGGSKEAFLLTKDILQSISAKVGDEPCCDYVGENGAGHYVKMVHNGIEYSDMQLIAETYAILRSAIGATPEKLGEIFAKFNEGKLQSYLIEITSKIFKYKENGKYVIDEILGCAGQKGTGKWACIDSLEEGIPLTMISEAVYARCLSSLLNRRVRVEKEYDIKLEKKSYDEEKLIKTIENALYAAKILSYTQGYELMNAAKDKYKWNLNFGKIALMWRGGCIIRSVFLGKIKEAYDKNPKLDNLLIDDYFKGAINECQKDLREVIKIAVDLGVAVPCYSSSLAYFDGMRNSFSSANLIQAQRDFFGAHTYEKIGEERGKMFHTNWTGEGGDTTAGDYKV